MRPNCVGLPQAPGDLGIVCTIFAWFIGTSVDSHKQQCSRNFLTFNSRQIALDLGCVNACDPISRLKNTLAIDVLLAALKFQILRFLVQRAEDIIAGRLAAGDTDECD
jgi:hypothetical protein